ncbi:MAG TPA: hypothetical protein PLN86_16855 [Candidatus Hydrogenedentes bacterium]|mgnify:CR=1 FL=1|nr:hypothetical protein [Candidatus Hydrogenedentota bacterium]
MKDNYKTKKQLIEELVNLRKEINELKNSPSQANSAGKLIQLAPDIVEKAFYSIWACRDSSKNYEILFWNQGAEKIYNTPREKAIGLNFVNTFVNDLEKRTSAAQIDEIIHDGRIFKNFLAIDHTPDGDNRMMLIDNFRIWDSVEGEYVQVEMALYVTESELLNSSDNLDAIREFEKKLKLLEEQKDEVAKTQPLIAEKQELITRKNIAIDLVHRKLSFFEFLVSRLNCNVM